MNRRAFIQLVTLALAGFGSNVQGRESPDYEAKLRLLEKQSGGRLGVSIVDIESGRRLAYRENERFPMCSTFKWLAVAALLARCDTEQARLDKRIRYDRDALMEWAPVTSKHVGNEGMTLDELCDAAITDSDNTATQLILDEIGGIAQWNAFIRLLGDASTRLDRGEPLLNEALPGDERDTTTPAAMNADLVRVLLGDVLSLDSRGQLKKWMLATKHSGARLRNQLPPGWLLADKTGTGNTGSGTANDVGIYWTPAGKPLVVSVYLTQARVSRGDQDAVIAQVGRLAREWVK